MRPFFSRVLAGLFAAFCCAAAPAWADDETPSVTLTALQPTPPGSVRAQGITLDIAGEAVKLSERVLVNGTASLMGLAGPVFSWGGDAEAYPDRQFPELTITVDGAPAQVRNASSAWYNGHDITALLRQAGLDVFLIAQSPPVVFAVPGRQAPFNQLVGQGAISELAGQDVALWSAQRKLAFPVPQGAHLVMLAYTARPASALLAVAQAGESITPSRYCLSAAALRAAAARAARGGEVIAAQYSIAVGIGAGPVTLKLRGLGGGTLPAPVAVFCGADGRPVLAPHGTGGGQARPDAAGNITILTIGAAAAP